MEKIIYDRKKQLNDMKQMLKMQNLLEEYDRENASLNRQVDELLKQNLILKQSNSISSFNVSRMHTSVQDYSSKSGKNAYFQKDQDKFSILTKNRKSRYNYLFDENELKDFKSSLKNEIKQQAKRGTLVKSLKSESKQVQTNTDSALQKFQNSIQIKETQKQQTQSKLHVQFIVDKKDSLSRSKSRSRSGSQKKLEVISKSRIYIEKSKQLKEKQDKIKVETLKNEQLESSSNKMMKQHYLQQQSQILQHSFGNKKSECFLQKKLTIIQSDMPSGLKQQRKLEQSRMSNKFIPLSIQSKQISTNMSKNLSTTIKKSEEGSNILNRSIQRTQSKSKRNHSLNPSPKVQLNQNRLEQKKITVNAFVLKTEEAIQAASIQLHRNPSEKIKRKFIKIVSNKKISSPNKQ